MGGGSRRISSQAAWAYSRFCLKTKSKCETGHLKLMWRPAVGQAYSSVDAENIPTAKPHKALGGKNQTCGLRWEELNWDSHQIPCLLRSNRMTQLIRVEECHVQTACVPYLSLPPFKKGHQKLGQNTRPQEIKEQYNDIWSVSLLSFRVSKFPNTRRLPIPAHLLEHLFVWWQTF